MALTELKGTKGGTQVVRIEAAPVRVFARRSCDDPAVFDGDGAPVPPTFPFVMPYWGSDGTGGAAGLPIEKLRGRAGRSCTASRSSSTSGGRRSATCSRARRRSSTCTRRRSRAARKLEFYVQETTWEDQATGEPVVTDRFTLIVRARR